MAVKKRCKTIIICFWTVEISGTCIEQYVTVLQWNKVRAVSYFKQINIIVAKYSVSGFFENSLGMKVQLNFQEKK